MNRATQSVEMAITKSRRQRRIGFAGRTGDADDAMAGRDGAFATSALPPRAARNVAAKQRCAATT